MSEFKAKLIDEIQRIPSIKSFRFEAESKIDFLPGQFLFVMFDRGNPKNRQLNKYLSFCSSPLKNYFEVTKKLSQSDFSKRLNNLKIGDELSFQGPMGNCIFKEEFGKIVFLIGGIGITPVISMIEYIVEKKLNTNAVLIYSNRMPEEMAFKKELDQWRHEAKNIRIIYIITDCKVPDPECIEGRIDKTVLAQKVDDLKERINYIFGPPAMVRAMKQLCIECGCDKNRIMAENFVGY